MARIIKKETQKKETPDAPANFKKRKNLSFKTKFKLALLIIAVFFLLNAVSLVAKTGLVQIPVFSSVFYRLPLPTRILELPDPFKPDPNNVKVTGSKDEGIMNFAFGEKELTYILRQALVEKRKTFAENLQLVITPDYLELYGLQLSPYKANITIRLKPAVKNEKLQVNLLAYKIGDLSIPPFVANFLLRKNFSNSGQTADALNKFVQIKNINLGDGRLDLTAKVNIQDLLKILSAVTASKTNQ